MIPALKKKKRKKKKPPLSPLKEFQVLEGR